MKKYLNGYITVEASILMPIVFFILCTVFYMCFSFHDRVITQDYMYRYGINTYFNEQEDNEKEWELKESLKKKLLISDVLSVRYVRTDEGIETGACISFRIPSELWEGLKYKFAAETANRNKSRFLRKCRAAKEVIE